jgi:hypothetical protein
MEGGVMHIAFTLAAMAEAACGVLLAPAGVASAEPSAIGTIGQLEAEGYTVNIDRIGSGPLSTCVVTSVRNPQTVTRLIRVDNGGRHGGKHGDGHDFDYIEVVVSRSISVSLDCTR